MKGLLFTYALTYGGAAASLFNPFIGLLIYVCFAIIRPEALWHWSVPAGNYSRIIAIGLLLGWLANGGGRWKFGRGQAVVAALLGFWGWAALGVLTASNRDVAWGFVEPLTKIVLPFLVGITTIDSVRKLKQLAWVILLSQGYIALELNLSYLQGFNQLQLVGFGGMDNNCVAIALVTCVGVAFFLGLGAPTWWQAALAFGAAAVMAHAVLFSFSRGGMLSLIVTGVVAFLLMPKQPKHYLAFALIVLLSFRLAGPEVVTRFATSFAGEEERDASAQSRLELWAGCWDTMLKRPILGAGPDHWPLIVEEYGWPRGKEAHTLWLQIGAELGFPGLICLASFYGLCIARLWPLTGERSHVIDPWFRDAARMVVAALVGFAFSAQFVSLEGLEVPYYVTLLGVGVLKLNSTGWDVETSLDLE